MQHAARCIDAAAHGVIVRHNIVASGCIERHIGNIKLGPIDWNQGFGDIGFIIGAKECWGKGYAAESIQLLAGYAFGSLKLHKLTASCYAVNIGAIKTLKKAGFEQLEKDDKYFSDGKAVDVVWFRLLEPNHG